MRAQCHESQTLADEIVSCAAITRPGSVSERTFTIRFKRRLGQ